MRSAQPYSRELTRAVEAVVSRSGSISHPFTTERPHPKRAAVLVLTSDSGFCGAYNANVLRDASRLRAMLKERGVEPVLYVTGTKGIVWHRFRELPLAGEWSHFSAQPDYRYAQEITEQILDAYNSNDVDEIHLVSTEFVSMLTQRPVARRVVPLEIEETTQDSPSGPLPQYEFEPAPDKVLDALLPQYVASRI